MSVLGINTAVSEIHFSKPLRYCAWFRSRWFRFSLASMVSLAIVIGLITEAPVAYLYGQIALGLSVYLSLLLLADRPLINPIQAVVALFYWWVGVGPTVIAIWNYLLGMPDVALQAEVSGMAALWIVIPGLFLYAIAARQTLQWLSQRARYARFLLPSGENYRPKIIIIYLSLMGFSMLSLIVLQRLGIQGQEETSFFGASKTTIWWVGVIAAVGSIAPFVTSALMTQLVSPWRAIPFTSKILILIVMVQMLMDAVFSGSKAPTALLIAYYASAYVSRRQRPPWLLLTVGGLLFLFVITPFVSYGRYTALHSGAVNSEMRKQVFYEVLNEVVGID